MNIISKVHPLSIAEEMDIEAGDKLLSINESEIKDIIDYIFMCSDEYITVQIEKINGEIWDLEIQKEYDESLGIEFQNELMDCAKSCSNNCVFCFVNQLPKGLRDTLYFKDDDSRLSFLMGNFITLTNLKDEDLDRIIRYRISPINISVHTTNDSLRIKMLRNKFAGDIMKKLKKLSDGGIDINCQIVLCPGINDGEELIKTSEDLFSLYPQIRNVAIVPVGITKFREGLYPLKTFNRISAINVIGEIEKIQKIFINKSGTPFVRLSDEFYILAGIDVPKADFYDGFEQIEDGVGMIRSFRDNIMETIKDLKKDGEGSFTIITGTLAYEEIYTAIQKINRANNNLNLNVVKIINNFFGNTITVAGLLTGKDIIEQLEGKNIGEYIIISENMIKKDERIFLDNVRIEDIENTFHKKVLVCSYTGDDLIKIINENS